MKIAIGVVTAWKGFWTKHGTKFLGYATAALGVCSEVLNYIQAVDPKHAALWALVVMLGVATIKRGHRNSSVLAEQQTP